MLCSRRVLSNIVECSSQNFGFALIDWIEGTKLKSGHSLLIVIVSPAGTDFWSFDVVKLYWQDSSSYRVKPH